MGKAVATATKSWVGRIPEVKAGTYADGLPLHEIHYLCCKFTLKPNHFTSRASLFDFGKVLRGPAKKHGVEVQVGSPSDKNNKIQVREVVFVDTEDSRLYKNSFILRRRIQYEDGFPIGEPEIVFKFRHSDIQTAAETDVRPNILGDHRVKFKCQALPLKGQLGGIRFLFSHNVQFPRSHAGDAGALSMGTMCQVFPVLESIKKDPDERVSLVSNTIIEEVLQNIGVIDFGDGLKAGTDVSLWRTRGKHRPIIGEFGFQIRFNERKDLEKDALRRAEAFFLALQYEAQDWIALDATKTSMVYRLNGSHDAGLHE